MTRVDMKATGKNIKQLAKDRKIQTAELQRILGFGTPQAIYKWYRGQSLPTVDNLVILADIFKVTIDDIIIKESKENGKS